jgi:predicted DNA-binding transcriptional regulator YafY
MSELTFLQRALKILNRLSSKDNVSINELYNYFDGLESKRTIQRTIDTIESSNIPLSRQSGSHNEQFFSLKRAFDYIPMMLDPDEVLAAVLLSQFSGVFDGTRIGKDIQDVFEKMKHLIPQDKLTFISDWQETSEALHFHQSGKIDFQSRENILKDIMQAVFESKICMVTYQGLNPHAREFEVYPYSLLFKDGAIYAVVYQLFLKKFVYLAVHRINDLTISDQHFKRDTQFKLSEFLKNDFGIFQLEPVDVVIHFKNKVSQIIKERIWHPSQIIQQLGNGDIILQMLIGPSEEFISWVLRWGPNAEVLEPLSLRTSIVDRLAQAHEQYFSND